MENKWTDEQIVEWITIIVIVSFVFFPSEMIHLSDTDLGKLFFVFMVIYYAMVDPVYGIIACAIVIMYYQLDLYHSLIALHNDILLRENMMAMEDSIIKDAIAGRHGMYSDVTGLLESYSDSRSSVAEQQKDFANMQGFTENITDPYYTSSATKYEPFSENIENYYEKEFLRGSIKSELLNSFRKSNCANGNLTVNGITVRPEMAEHVFREIKFPNSLSKCNPCEESCEFSIIEERLTREDELRPVSSKDLEIDWNQFFGHYIVKPITSIADDIYLLENKVSKLIFPNIL